MGDFYSGLNNADGKYVVPEPLAKEILGKIEINSGAIPFLRSWPMSSKTEDITMVDDEPEASVVSTEGGQKSTSKGSFSQITLTTKEIAVIIPFTDEWAENAQLTALSFLREEGAKAIAKKLDRIYLGYEDTGTFTEDISGDIPNDHIIAKGTGDDLLADLSNALGAVEEDGFTDNIGWLTHPAVKKEFRNLRDDNGLPIFQPANGKEPATLYGYPIRFSRNMIKTGSPSDYEMIVGDWKYGIEGVRDGLRFDVTNQATVTIGGEAINLWEHNMSAIKLWIRRAFRLRDENAFAKVTGMTG